MKKLLLIVIFVLLVLSADAFSNTVNLSSELYLYERDSLSHSRFYQGLTTTFDLYAKDLSNIKFKSYSKWTNDFSNKKSNDPMLNIFDAYLEFNKILKSLSLKAGRHFAYNYSGSSLIDGATVRFNGSDFGSGFLNNVDVKLFIGSGVDRLEPDRIQNFSENFVVGFNSTYQLNSTKIDLNFQGDKIDDEFSRYRAGLNINHKFNSQFKVFARAGFDFSELAELRFRLNYRKDAVYFSGEYLHQKPNVSENSVFSLIDYDKKNRIRGNIRYRLNRKYSLFFNSYYSMYSDKDAFSGSIGFASSYYSIAYSFYTGRTENNGLTISAHHRINNNLSLYGSANLNQYKVQKEYDETLDAYAVSAGVQKRFKNDYQIKVEYQLLSNANEDSSSRIYLRLNKGISF